MKCSPKKRKNDCYSLLGPSSLHIPFLFQRLCQGYCLFYCIYIKYYAIHLLIFGLYLIINKNMCKKDFQYLYLEYHFHIVIFKLYVPVLNRRKNVKIAISYNMVLCKKFLIIVTKC